MVEKLNKADFNAGSPYSSWLKEKIIGEIYANKNGAKNRGLAKKYNVVFFDGIDMAIMNNIKTFDDYPENIRNMATEIIQLELDETFEK